MRKANTKYQRHRLVFGSRNWHTSPFYEQKHSCGVLRKSHLTAKQYLIKLVVVSNINASIYIYIILMHIYLYIFEPVYHCLNQEQERGVRLAENLHATNLDWSGWYFTCHQHRLKWLIIYTAPASTEVADNLHATSLNWSG